MAHVIMEAERCHNLLSASWSVREADGIIQAEAQGLRSWGAAGVSRRRGLDPELLWFWRRPVAIALIKPLAWEPPYAARSGPRKEKKKKEFPSWCSG